MQLIDCHFTCIVYDVYSSFRLQNPPSVNEINNAVSEALADGQSWKLYKLKYRLLKEQSIVDSTSVDYQLYNYYLLIIYQSIGDVFSLQEPSEELYDYLNAGGEHSLKSILTKEEFDSLRLLTYYSISVSCLETGEISRAETFGKRSMQFAKSSIDSQLVVMNLAKLYDGQLRKAINDNDSQLCFSTYMNAAELFLQNKSFSTVYHTYFDPHAESIEQLFSILPSSIIPRFCDMVIDVDSVVCEEEYVQDLISPDTRQIRKADILSLVAFNCLQCAHYSESILYHSKAIDFVNAHSDINWNEFDLIRSLYATRAIAYQRNGEWVNSVFDDVMALKTSLSVWGPDSDNTKRAFYALNTLVEIATEASISYVNTIYTDKMHPHLSYDDNIKILNAWRFCLNEIKEGYGESYLQVLKYNEIKANRISYKEQIGVDRPTIINDRLGYLSTVDYRETLLNIMDNRLNSFRDSYNRLLGGIVSDDGEEDKDELRYDATVAIANSLSHAGYYEWGITVLGDYMMYIHNQDYEASEKLEKMEKAKTLIGMFAWKVMDIEKLVWATSDASFITESENRYLYSIHFFDINELITQLVLLSRLQSITAEADAAKETLSFAKEIMDKDVPLSNGVSLSAATKSMLYNELAGSSDNPRNTVELLKLALEYEDENEFDYSTRINLAFYYARYGEYSKSDSVLVSVLKYGNDHYIEPAWKSNLYKILMYNALLEQHLVEAQKLSSKRLAVQIQDYIQISQSLTSVERENYWEMNFGETLENASTIDLACGEVGETSYNAALFQKSILMRQKRTIKNNILGSDYEQLKDAFEKYNRGVRSMSDSAKALESYCMYLYSLHPEFVSTLIIPQWQDVKCSLNMSDLAIEFSVSRDPKTDIRYFAAILLRSTFDAPIIVPLCKYDDLVSVASRKDDTGFPIDLYENNSILYHLIWAPLEKYLDGVKTIYYAPYEYLNNINVTIAAEGKGGMMIGDKYRLFRVSSTAELADEGRDQIQQAVLFGNIDYNADIATVGNIINTQREIIDYSKLRGSMGGTWGPLTNTAYEMNGIRDCLKKKGVAATVYSSGQGTEATFKSLSGNSPDLIHMATHGFYYTVEEASKYNFFTTSTNGIYNPGVRSGLVLSGGNHAWIGESVLPGAEDGILTADEISGMDLSGTRLLTLSACQTALGDLASDGIYGVQRSFKTAGVRTIIMSLWKVDDEATYIMMNKFYQLLTGGMEIHSAFKHAQSFTRSWAEKKVKQIEKDIMKLPSDVREWKRKQYGGRLYPEYYWGAFVMLD